MNLTEEQEIIIRETIQREKKQRIQSESELSVLYKTVSDYIFNNNIYDKILNKAIDRTKEYLKEIGIITR